MKRTYFFVEMTRNSRGTTAHYAKRLTERFGLDHVEVDLSIGTIDASIDRNQLDSLKQIINHNDDFKFFREDYTYDDVTGEVYYWNPRRHDSQYSLISH